MILISIKYFIEIFLEKDYDMDIPKKLNLGIASCVSYQIKNTNAYQLNLKLILTSLLLLINNLESKGNLVINLTIKNINFAFNIVFILGKLFEKVVFGEVKVWPVKILFISLDLDLNLILNTFKKLKNYY